jgi:cytoskeleton protein RodZ
MSESDDSEQEAHEPAAFGRQLMLAREKAGMTLDEAARALNLHEGIVEAIEDSDFDKLPPVAFVKGYVRNYARLLDLSEEVLISEFEKELPRNLEKELQPRSFLPNEADSQTPVIKLISMLIIVSAVVVFIYATYSYYIEKSETIEQASLSEPAEERLQPQSALDQPQAEIIEYQDQSLVDAVLPEGEELEIREYAAIENDATLAETAPKLEELPEQKAEAEIADASTAESVSEPVDKEALPVPTVAPITGGDVLSVSAEQESWAEIIDANDIRLFYGMIKPGKDLRLTGQTPFEIFLGNAPMVSLSLNDIDVDMTKYIRSNNIAQFKVSVEDGRLRFD